MSAERLPVLTAHERHLLEDSPDQFVAKAWYREVPSEDSVQRIVRRPRSVEEMCAGDGASTPAATADGEDAR